MKTKKHAPWKTGLGLLLIGLIASKTYAAENVLFAYTHLLPSPFTLSAGQVAVGTSTSIGVTDAFELQTDLIRDFYKIYNIRGKFSLLDFPGFAVGLNLGYQYVNLQDISSSNPALSFSSWMPGAVIGMEVLPDVALFLGGNFFYSSQSVSGNGIDTSGFLQGAQIESDLSWAYHPKGSRLGNIISAGATYNSTFDFYGVGISHHWPGLHIGFHYYPNASSMKILPILSGGAVFEI